MLKIWDPDNFRRTLAGICCFAAPLALLAGLLVHPGESDGGLIGSVAQHPGRVQAASLLIVASSILFVPALVGLLALVRGRGVVLAHLGVALTITGALGHAVFAGFQIVLVAAVQGGVDRAQLAALVEGTPDAGFVAVMLMFMIGFFPGLLLIAAALWRSRAVPVWASVALVGLVISDFVPLGGPVAAAAGPVLGVSGFAAVGVSLLQMSDQEWGRTALVPGVDRDLAARIG